MEVELEARERVLALLADGRAETLLDAWSHYGQTWPYLVEIIGHVAENGSDLTAREFARNLLEDAGK